MRLVPAQLQCFTRSAGPARRPSAQVVAHLLDVVGSVKRGLARPERQPIGVGVGAVVRCGHVDIHAPLQAQRLSSRKSGCDSASERRRRDEVTWREGVLGSDETRCAATASAMSS